MIKAVLVCQLLEGPTFGHKEFMPETRRCWALCKVYLDPTIYPSPKRELKALEAVKLCNVNLDLGEVLRNEVQIE